jgi:NRPS condensation-like uncharacterized protein
VTAARPAGSAAPALDEYIALQHGFNDHRIRAVLELSGHVDDDRLAAAVEASFIAIPLLTCGFVLTPRGGRWVEPGRPAGRAWWRAVDAAGPYDEASAVEAALGAPIDEATGPQVALTRVRAAERDVLVLVVGHVVMDGTGLRAYLALLARAYRGEAAGPPGGGRDLLAGLAPAVPGAPAVRVASRAPLVLGGGTDADPRPRLTLWRGSVAAIEGLRAGAANPRPTINDCALAAVLAAVGGELAERSPGRGRGLELAFMVDARRYATVPISPFANASTTSRIAVADVMVPLGELVAQVARRTAALKAGTPGLADLHRLRTARRLLPFPLVARAVRATLRGGRPALTNLGRLDLAELAFGDVEARDAYVVTALKEAPAFQVAFVTAGEHATFSSYGRYGSRDAAVVERVYARLADTLGGAHDSVG